jgi:hypothetical protein
MPGTNKEEQIFIGNNDMVVELLGEAKAEFIAQREADNAERLLLEAKESERKQLRIDAITKLGAASGLTEEEINSILNI